MRQDFSTHMNPDLKSIKDKYSVVEFFTKLSLKLGII